MKPITDMDCTRLPPWARWLAQDADGCWWAYEHEPNPGEKSWYENEVGAAIKLLDAEPNPDWRRALIRVKK